MAELDKVDKKILELLKTNSNMTFKNLAERLASVKKFTASGVKRRVEKLIHTGVIKRYTIVVDPNEINNISAIILIEVNYPMDTKDPLFQYKLAHKIAKIENVTWVYLVTGTWDLIACVSGENIREISFSVLKDLRSLPGVKDTETEIVLYTAKENRVILPKSFS